MLFQRKPKRNTRKDLETEIQSLIDSLKDHEEGTEEYRRICEDIVILKKAQTEDAARKLKPDTVFMVCGNILVVGLVCFFEQNGHLIRTQATRFLMKGRG